MDNAHEQIAGHRRGASLHYQVFTVIREWIASGRYAPGTALPGEQVLAEDFGVSRVTVRTAISALHEAGWVEKRHGVGTFVRDIRSTDSTVHASMTDMLRHIRDVGRDTQVRVISVDSVVVPPMLRDVFKDDDQQSLQRVVRVRSVRGQPVFHVVTYVPQTIAANFTRTELRKKSMLELLRECGIALHSGQQVVSATLAEPQIASLLRVQSGDPLLKIRRLHRDDTGRTVEYLEMLASPQRFELHMDLDADDVTDVKR